MLFRVLLVLSILLSFNLASFSQDPKLIKAPKALRIQECSDNLVFESNEGDSLIRYTGYSVLYSYRRKLPLFTFNTIFPYQLETVGKIPATRSNRFIPVKLPNGTYSASNVDYYKSGYDRGHMVPAGDFSWDQKLKDETFLYTNINPQSPNLNRGIWANLENAVRNEVLKKQEHVHVITGVVFEELFPTKIGPDSLLVPFAFFKILYFPQKGNMLAFLFDNTIEQYLGNLSDFQVTVDFLEVITGEDFFDKLPNSLENTLESTITPFIYSNEK